MVLTAWVALACLVAGEVALARSRSAGTGPRWAWAISLGGCAALALHMLVAMGVRHGWSHENALADTARQTSEVYGVAWGGGLYVNYAFLGLWMAWLLYWKMSPAVAGRRTGWLIWSARAVVLVVVVNAAVVFAAPGRRLLGAALTLALLAAWAAPSRATVRPPRSR
jgi:hypothetical protein